MLAWLIFFSLPYLLHPTNEKYDRDRMDEKQAWAMYVYFTYLVMVVFFYLNAWVFIPKLVYKKKIVDYILYIVGIFIFMCTMRYTFEKIFLKPGETKTVEMQIKVSGLAFYDESKKTWNTEAGEYILQLGNSSRTIFQKAKISVK